MVNGLTNSVFLSESRDRRFRQHALSDLFSLIDIHYEILQASGGFFWGIGALIKGFTGPIRLCLPVKIKGYLTPWFFEAENLVPLVAEFSRGINDKACKNNSKGLSCLNATTNRLPSREIATESFL